jgi:hypothetical protein
MAGGFLNRWSRRKAGEQLEPEKKLADDAKPESTNQPLADRAVSELTEAPAPMSLDDVEKIDRLAPDFSGFMKPGVDPVVQQAAMKKMFSDPHFNVMDGLDIYIDDYSKPDPLPLEMLKRMVQSDMLNIFRKGNGEDKEAIELADTAEKSKLSEKIVTQAPESQGQALPLSDQTDLTSTHSALDLGVENKDPIPADKKTNEEDY